MKVLGCAELPVLVLHFLVRGPLVIKSHDTSLLLLNFEWQHSMKKTWYLMSSHPQFLVGVLFSQSKEGVHYGIIPNIHTVLQSFQNCFCCLLGFCFVLLYSLF